MQKGIPFVEEVVEDTETQAPSSNHVTTPSTYHEKVKTNSPENFCQVLFSLTKSAATTWIQSLTSFISYTCLTYFVSLKNDPKLIGCLGLGASIQFVFVTTFIIALNVGL